MPLTTSAKLDLCLVAHFAYGALTGGEQGHVGGVERQTSLMARWLADRGHGVGLVTWATGPPHDEVIHGVRVFKTCASDAGWPLLRFVHPRWTGLDAALTRADARTYYQNCAEEVTGQVAFWSRRHGRRFVYSVASDMDCDPRLPDLVTWRERQLYRYGLRRADRVIAQTATQGRMLRTGFDVAAHVIPMPCPGPSESDFVPPTWAPAGRVLWVGRICNVKRPDRLLDVADQCPQLAFDVVGPADEAHGVGIVRRARELPNVTVHGRASRAQMDGFYRRAAALLCTSDYEGFPNTFIEAWSHGIPVVSTHDPDGLIDRLGLGASVAPKPAAIATALQGLLRSREDWTAASGRARRYYLENHTVDRVMRQFEAELILRPEAEVA